MVKQIKKNNKKYFQCEVCKFVYEDQKMGGKCQAWCDKNPTCNLEITKNAVQL